MSQYKVSWGPDELVAEAETSQDAWAAFVNTNDLAARQPKLHERRIEKLEPVKAAPVVPLVEAKPAVTIKK